MCVTFNKIGSLKEIEYHLKENKISDLHSIDDLQSFYRNYSNYRNKIISHHNVLIYDEKKSLEKEISELETKFLNITEYFEKQKRENLEKSYSNIENLPKVNNNPFLIIKDYYLNLMIWLEIWFIPIIYFFKYNYAIRCDEKHISNKKKRYDFITYKFDQAVIQSGEIELMEIDKKYHLIDFLKNYIYGAIGEEKVSAVLGNLSDDYILINDFCNSFKKVIRNPNESDFIKSIQVDHLVVSPSGIFLIETKNWSENSINNIDLHSPIMQVKRSNYALFKILNDEQNKSLLNLKKHHFGKKKIPIKNIVVFINNKPKEEFQFVKILILDDLLSYIKYFEPIFSVEETRSIANFLLKISNK
ncbi:nuclease-related domain-containing protein [Flavobacterium agrisoli]|uniref:NERD domain-containing protein n=1 Tax=Flavobacterium agrisoli TaxID=2793066 RepID=A0A934UKF1_9FLAO|nr:nuclease-related domain-containing protein [Flavobacterium agrisoli]MBK0370907.1 NERD domain-containing protein [Flavobacterium agrisoli]